MKKEEYTINISLPFLREVFEDNREIEFTLDGHMFFAAPKTDSPLPKCYGLLDVPNKTWIFEGSIDELFSFPFPAGHTLERNLDNFDFLYIL